MFRFSHFIWKSGQALWQQYLPKMTTKLFCIFMLMRLHSKSTWTNYPFVVIKCEIISITRLLLRHGCHWAQARMQNTITKYSWRTSQMDNFVSITEVLMEIINQPPHACREKVSEIYWKLTLFFPPKIIFWAPP